MKEARGDLWGQVADALCVTTNGSVTADGLAVMGGGCALEARARVPGAAEVLGRHLRGGGNHVCWIGKWITQDVFAFPVKHDVRERADLDLIVRSAHELVELASGLSLGEVVVPRPGCGLGGRRWDEVGPLLAPILDDRFTIITF